MRVRFTTQVSTGPRAAQCLQCEADLPGVPRAGEWVWFDNTNGGGLGFRVDCVDWHVSHKRDHPSVRLKPHIAATLEQQVEVFALYPNADWVHSETPR